MRKYIYKQTLSSGYSQRKFAIVHVREWENLHIMYTDLGKGPAVTGP